MNILRLDATARMEGSYSRDLVDALIAQLDDSANVTTRDLSDPISHVDDLWVAANNTADDDRTPDQHAKLAESDALIAEIEAADILVIGLPVYNFGVPASLKVWIDQICRARKTFAYGENGPVGLLKDKRAIVVYVSGGTPMGSEIDFASGFLRHILGFIGISDVRFVAADRHMMDADSIDRARGEIQDLASELKLAAAA